MTVGAGDDDGTAEFFDGLIESGRNVLTGSDTAEVNFLAGFGVDGAGWHEVGVRDEDFRIDKRLAGGVVDDSAGCGGGSDDSDGDAAGEEKESEREESHYAIK